VGDQTAELAEDAAVLSLAERLSPQDCQLFYQMGLLARRDLPLAPDPQAGFEMALLRMLAFRPADFNPAGGTPPAPRSAPPVRPASTPSAAPKPLSAASAAPVTPAASASAVAPPAPPAVPAPSIEMPVAPPTEPAPSNEAHVAPPVPTAAPAPVVAGIELDWPDLVSRLETIPLAREFARNCALRAFDGRQLEVVVSPQFQNLRVERTLKALEEALQNLLGAPVSLKVTVESGSGLATPAAAIEAAKAARQAAAESAIDADSTVQALQARFGATVEHVRTLP
jgi:DNA polymerase-3 subunit gamma/tau